MAGGTGGILFVPTHIHTLIHTLVHTDADLVRGQTPGLSALVTQIHTHIYIHTRAKMRCPFTLGLSEAAILPSGGICVLLVRKRGLEVGVLMNNAAGNEMGDDGDRNASSQQLVYMCFAVL